MRSLPAPLQANIAALRVTTYALCWQITFNNDVVVRGTEHDRDIEVASGTFAGTDRSQFNITASDIKSSSDLSVDNLEVEGATEQIFAMSIRVEDIESGILEGASVVVLKIDWQAPNDGQAIVRAGYLGTITRDSNEHYRAEIRGLAQKLSQQIGQNYSELCNVVRFGDARCTFDVSTITQEGVVASVTDRRHFTVEVASPSSAQALIALPRGGEVTWTSGENAGFTREVKLMTLALPATFIIELYEEAAADVEVGDLIDVIPGCDRRASTCRFVYDNLDNFRGYGVFIPGALRMMAGNSVSGECVVPELEGPDIPDPGPVTDDSPGLLPPPDSDDSPGTPPPEFPDILAFENQPGGPPWLSGLGATNEIGRAVWESWLGYDADIVTVFSSRASTWTAFRTGRSDGAVRWEETLAQLPVNIPIVHTYPMVATSVSNRRLLNPGMWDDFIAGDFDDHYAVMAQNMRTLILNAGRSPSSVILRLGHEMNGDWYPWSIGNKVDEFKLAWERAVGIIRDYMPTMLFDFSPARRYVGYTTGVNYGGGPGVNLAGFLPASWSFNTISRSHHDVNPHTTSLATWLAQSDPPPSAREISLDECVAACIARGKMFALSEWGTQMEHCSASHPKAPDPAQYIARTYDWLWTNRRYVAWDTYFCPAARSSIVVRTRLPGRLISGCGPVGPRRDAGRAHRIRPRLLGAPYRHQGRNRYGVDCIGFPIALCSELGLLPRGFKDVRNYGRSPDGQMEPLVGSYCARLADPEVGCLLLIKWPTFKAPSHAALLACRTMLHSYQRAGGVVENGFRGPWLRHLHSAWRLPGIG